MTQLIRPRQVPAQKRPLTADSWEILRQIDECLLDRDKRDALTYRTLRRKLNRVPRAERGKDWAERVVAIYCVKHRKTSRAAAIKINIRNRRLDDDETKELDAFFQRLRETTAPYVLTNHGLLLPFAQRDQDEVANDLIALFSLLQELGYEAFINSGTLLGAVREGQFLGHDDDADLAVCLKGETDAQLVQSLEELCEALNASGALLKPAWYHKSGPILKVLTGSGIEVDLFPLWFRGDQAFIWPHTYGDLTKQDIFPLGEQTLCGKAMPAPRDAEKMLEVNYGKGWRHPDPDYFFPWGLAKIRFESVLAEYAERRQPKTFAARLARFLKRNTK